MEQQNKDELQKIKGRPTEAEKQEGKTGISDEDWGQGSTTLTQPDLLSQAHGRLMYAVFFTFSIG